MAIGRKLLFHRGDLDDSIGTYVSDYILAGVSYIVAGYLVYKVWKLKPLDDVNVGESSQRKSWYWWPWNWPRPVTTSITMATYGSICIAASYGTIGLLGGLPHQFLQQVEPYQDPSDAWGWVIVWRFAAASAVVTVGGMYLVLEQTYQQESFMALPPKFRKMFYASLVLTETVSLILSFALSLGAENPFGIAALFVTFMLFTLLYGFGMLIVALRSSISKKPTNDYITPPVEAGNKSGEVQVKRETRWDLIFHSLCPWIIVMSGVFSYILTPFCSHHNDAHGLHGCPLPNSLNHNFVMHLAHALAVVCVGIGEDFAIKRRARSCRGVSNNNGKVDETIEKVLLE